MISRLTLPTGEAGTVIRVDVPPGTERIWCSDSTGAPTLRPLDGLGPKGHRPAGFLTLDDRIVLDPGTPLSDLAIGYLRDFFTGPMRLVDDLADMPAELRNRRFFGWCRLCENPHGKRHSNRCPHASKLVGDKVR